LYSDPRTDLDDGSSAHGEDRTDGGELLADIILLEGNPLDNIYPMLKTKVRAEGRQGRRRQARRLT